MSFSILQARWQMAEQSLKAPPPPLIKVIVLQSDPFPIPDVFFSNLVLDGPAQDALPAMFLFFDVIVITPIKYYSFMGPLTQLSCDIVHV